ncbi:hypothetical protein ACZ11_24240 [Lysinibacillus xylanilyticus]|uniref:Uncharacterized protein n=1 Tax=Lysinibacillus xylanilyticus TaxID=582475 RepID=A0A0K9F2M9_9BACI|nr:hypothetical protein [Lysinibacillus xylanilyticus]KMY28338.1 hypothetical protein ACZ11_24240 [Lysinibacillus xylanilyticus]
MSRLGQQVFFARKRSANVAAAIGVHSVRKRSATKRQQQQDVGHEGVITGRDGFSLRSYTTDPQGVAQPPLQSTFIQGIRFNQCHHLLLMMSQINN